MKTMLSLSLITTLAIGNQCFASAQHPLSGANKKAGHENAQAPQVAGAPLPQVGAYAAGVAQEGQDALAIQHQREEEEAAAINEIVAKYGRTLKSAQIFYALKKHVDTMKIKPVLIDQAIIDQFVVGEKHLSVHDIGTNRDQEAFLKNSHNIDPQTTKEFLAQWVKIKNLYYALTLDAPRLTQDFTITLQLKTQQ